MLLVPIISSSFLFIHIRDNLMYFPSPSHNVVWTSTRWFETLLHFLFFFVVAILPFTENNPPILLFIMQIVYLWIIDLFNFSPVPWSLWNPCFDLRLPKPFLLQNKPLHFLGLGSFNLSRLFCTPSGQLSFWWVKIRALVIVFGCPLAPFVKYNLHSGPNQAVVNHNKAPP